MAFIHNYQTGELIRGATRDELQRSLDAAERDGGPGVFQDLETGVSVYATGELSEFDIELATRQDFADLNEGHWGRPNRWSYRRDNEEHERFSDEGGLGNDCSMPYSDFEGSPNNPRASYVTDSECKWYMPGYTGGSDYSGGSVCESNYRVLVRECERIDTERGRKDDEPTFWQTFHGGHGTYAIAFHVEKTPKEVFEMLAALEDHPLLDESDHSELELEQQDEAWENWAASDYRRALEKEFNGDADEVSDDDLFEHFHTWAEKANECWREDGTDQWIDVGRIAKKADEPPEGFVCNDEPDMPEENLQESAL